MDGFDFSMLLPHLAAITSDDAEFLQRINGIFGVALLFVFSVAAVYAIVKWLSVSSQVRFLLSLLTGLQPDSLLEVRRDLKAKAEAGSSKGGENWLEYDEALVTAGDPPRLYLSLIHI